MALCHQETSHYLRQCRPKSVSPYGIDHKAMMIIHWSLGDVAVIIFKLFIQNDTGIIFFMRPANERRRYIVTSSLIGPWEMWQ